MRLGDDAKRAFEEVFAAMVGVLERSVKDKKQERRAKAQAVAALCVGAMGVARSIENRSAADELCDAGMSMALHLGDCVGTGVVCTSEGEEAARGQAG